LTQPARPGSADHGFSSHVPHDSINTTNTDSDDDDDDHDDDDDDMMMTKGDSYDDHIDLLVHICQAQVASPGGCTPISLLYWRSTNSQKRERSLARTKRSPRVSHPALSLPTHPALWLSSSSTELHMSEREPAGLQAGRDVTATGDGKRPFVFHVMTAFALLMV
jgi:hypothetical protein